MIALLRRVFQPKAAQLGLAVLLGLVMGGAPVAAAPANQNRLPDGVYLYGESPQPDQMGKGYIVFEVKQGQMTGALYMPRSSFNCFDGVVQSDFLALQVTEAYTGERYPFKVALNNRELVASNHHLPDAGLNLNGMHRISTISQNDYRILNICKADQ